MTNCLARPESGPAVQNGAPCPCPYCSPPLLDVLRRMRAKLAVGWGDGCLVEWSDRSTRMRADLLALLDGAIRREEAQQVA